MKVAVRAAKSELPVRDPAKGKVTEQAAEPTPKVRTITGHVRDPKGRPLVESVCMSILGLSPVCRSNDSTPRPPTEMGCSSSMAYLAGRSRSI